MKSSRSYLCNDPSQKSLDALKSRCEAYFGNEKVWFPDHHDSYPGEALGPVTSVLFGNFFQRFIETGNWTYPSYNLWVLSQASKEVMTHVLGFPEKKIGVIPRERLFPVLEKMPSANSPLTLVCGGRISPQKNIAMTLRTAVHLRREEKVPVKLVFSGSWDNLQHPEVALPITDHRAWINELLADVALEDRPDFVQGSSEDWFLKSFENPVYFSLSTFICEDFNVSLAQAQSQGWPAMVSQWGGHRDTRGWLRLIPEDAIAASDKPTWLIDLKAKALAKSLGESWRQGCLFKRIPPSPEVTQHPEPISQVELDELRRTFVRSLGHDGILLREAFPIFGSTAKGAKVFEKYRNFFSGKTS